MNTYASVARSQQLHERRTGHPNMWIWSSASLTILRRKLPVNRRYRRPDAIGHGRAARGRRELRCIRVAVPASKPMPASEFAVPCWTISASMTGRHALCTTSIARCPRQSVRSSPRLVLLHRQKPTVVAAASGSESTSTTKYWQTAPVAACSAYEETDRRAVIVSMPPPRPRLRYRNRNCTTSSSANNLARSIDKLPEREKLVLSLYYEQELNLKEIGAVLDVSANPASARFMARRSLRLRGDRRTGKVSGDRRWQIRSQVSIASNPEYPVRPVQPRQRGQEAGGAQKQPPGAREGSEPERPDD